MLRTETAWPRLTLDEWAPTQSTLHRWAQIVGKTRLALAPMQNHWWQVVLYVTDRGLTTSPIPYNGRTFDVSFDFVDHHLAVVTSDGDERNIPLAPRSVADFYREYMSMLRSLDIDVRLYGRPVEIVDDTPFANDRAHASYDADAAHRCWRILLNSDRVFRDFRGRFLGKSSPSHFWWGGFDLACTRFSGRRGPEYAGAIPNCPAYVMKEAYSHECISAGWWPGSVDSPVTEPSFYAYSYPEPPGFDVAPVAPEGAYYHKEMREWFLPYERVRSSPDPDQAILAFLQTSYEAGANLAKWDRAALERPVGWSPPPSAAH
ncbi:MAG TPA: DUF5996 family protein [Gemmatimonadaceae bacterium]|jgi:hypothetical protein